MATKLPEPGVWLDAQLKKMHLSQNEAARMAHLSSGTLSKFTAGHVSEKAAVKIANFFNAPTQLVLAMVGLAPPPASMMDVETERLAHMFAQLDAERKEKLIAFAEFLLAQR